MEFRDKKIALLGFGLENQALMLYLRKRGADITICDQNLNLKKIDGLKYRLGADCLKNITDFDIVFRSPGIPFLRPEIQEAKKAGVLVTSQTKLFFEECPAKIIGVTGTKGKGTTSVLLFKILQRAKKAGHFSGHVFLVGNIGRPAITILEKAQKNDWVIFELSSFQLQDLDKSPQIALVLPISADHLDHHKDLEEYIESKRNIVAHQTEKDFAIVSDDNEISADFAAHTRALTLKYSTNHRCEPGAYISRPTASSDNEALRVSLPDGKLWDVCRLLGFKLSNIYLENTLAAALTAALAGAAPADIGWAITHFKGLPHRLEYLGKIKGVDYYDDSFATTPAATIAALRSFNVPITLIAGGSGKGADYTDLVAAIIRGRVKNVICIGPEGERIKDLLAKERPPQKIVSGLKTMSEILKSAITITEKGGVVLLSPAAASFDMFKNATERGERFRAEFRKRKILSFIPGR